MSFAAPYFDEFADFNTDERDSLNDLFASIPESQREEVASALTGYKGYGAYDGAEAVEAILRAAVAATGNDSDTFVEMIRDGNGGVNGWSLERPILGTGADTFYLSVVILDDSIPGESGIESALDIFESAARKNAALIKKGQQLSN